MQVDWLGCVKWGVLGACLAVMPGCATFVLRGNVVQGDVADMAFVPPDDPRLAGVPVANVRITLERDPDKLSREMAGTALSDSRGRFTIPVDQFGAGWMQEIWMIRASRQGYSNVVSQQRLNIYEDYRLLIMMPSGMADPSSEDWRDQYEKFR